MSRQFALPARGELEAAFAPAAIGTPVSATPGMPSFHAPALQSPPKHPTGLTENAVWKPPLNAREERSAAEGLPTSYRTSRGSSYELHDDGTTTRTKSSHEDVGHDANDQGRKERSERTVYASKDIVAALSSAGMANIGSRGSRLVIRDGKASLLTWNERESRWGVAPSGKDVPVQEKPAMGLSPLELWRRKDDIPGFDEAYSSMHAGNEITELTSRPDPPSFAQGLPGPAAVPSFTLPTAPAESSPDQDGASQFAAPNASGSPSLSVPPSTSAAPPSATIPPHVLDDTLAALLALGTPAKKAEATMRALAASTHRPQTVQEAIALIHQPGALATFAKPAATGKVSTPKPAAAANANPPATPRPPAREGSAQTTSIPGAPATPGTVGAPSASLPTSNQPQFAQPAAVVQSTFAASAQTDDPGQVPSTPSANGDPSASIAGQPGTTPAFATPMAPTFVVPASGSHPSRLQPKVAKPTKPSLKRPSELKAEQERVADIRRVNREAAIGKFAMGFLGVPESQYSKWDWGHDHDKRAGVPQANRSDATGEGSKELLDAIRELTKKVDDLVQVMKREDRKGDLGAGQRAQPAQAPAPEKRQSAFQPTPTSQSRQPITDSAQVIGLARARTARR